MGKRQKILTGMAAGALWALAVVWGGQRVSFGFSPLPVILPLVMVPAGILMLLMIARLAQRRFFDDTIIDGQDFAPGSPAWVDQRVLANTTEQALLALLIWPFVGLTLGPSVIIVMGIAFAVSRIAFWVGYHVSPPLRAFGFAATFYTTVLAAIWSLVVWMF